MRVTRVVVFLCAALAPMSLAAQTPCTWSTDQTGKVVETCGNVGIGTSSPSQLLHVFSSADANTFVKVENNNATGLSSVGVFQSAADVASLSLASHGSGRTLQRYGITLGGWNEVLSWVGNGLITGTLNSTPLVFGTNNVERLRITAGGNFGIGTTNPLANPNVPQQGLEVVSPSLAALWLTGNGHSGATIRGRNINAGNTATASGDLLLAVGGLGYDGAAYAPVNMAVITFYAGENWSSTSQGTYMTFTTTQNGTLNRAERMRIDNAGNVSVTGGNLSVTGNITATGSITGASVIGAVYQDVAEWVPAAAKMEPGTVVVLNPEHNNEVMASREAYDTRVAGVVSANPGVILGQGADSKAMIATTGRVRVRVDAAKHPIHIGDLLVTSDANGTAMVSEPMDINGRKFHQPGTVIGKALEPLESGRGEILVLLSLQ